MMPFSRCLRFLLLLAVVATNSAYVVGSNPDEVKKVVDYIKKEQGLKVFVNDKKKVYWPIDLPFFVRLATGDSGSSESYLLKDVRVKKLEGDQRQMNEGVRLDIPGAQFLRWVNHVSQEETMFRFVADGGAPTTSLKYFGAPRFSDGKTVYFGKGLGVKVQSKDEHSGVKSIFYDIDQKGIEEYLKPLKILTENEYRLGHAAVDNVGYKSRVKTEYFTVDTSAPKTDVSYEQNHIATTFSRETVIRLASLDKLSGVEKIFYKFNNEEKFKQYDKEQGISVSDLKSGSQILKYFSVDQVKNRESSNEFKFVLDRVPPQVAYTFLGDYHISKKAKYISPSTQISLDATDSLSEVAEIRYRINGDQAMKYSSVFLPAVNEGKFSLAFQATDALKNQSREENVDIIVDKDSPTTTHSIAGPVHKRKNGGVYFVSKKSTLSLKSEDDHSGVEKITVQVNTGSPTVYEKSMRFTKEGRYLVRYWAKDRVSNRERINPILIIVDNSAPEIVETFSFDPAGADKAGKENLPVYTKNISIGLSARDDEAGVSSVEYTLDGKEWKPYEKFLRFPNEGIYTLKVRARDNVGNNSGKVVKFKVVGEGWGTYAH